MMSGSDGRDALLEDTGLHHREPIWYKVESGDGDLAFGSGNIDTHGSASMEDSLADGEGVAKNCVFDEDGDATSA